MNFSTILTFCLTIAVASARPQFEEFQQNQNFPNPSNPWLNPSSAFSDQFPNNFANQNLPGFTNSFPSQANNQNFNPNQNNQNTFGSFVPNPNNPFLPNQNTNSGSNQGNINTEGTLDQFVQPQQSQQQQSQQQQQQQSQQQQRPQQQANQNQNQSGGNQETTTAASANPAIAQLKTSSQYVECNTGCIVLNEYNPVCGSDNVTYNNERKLECANNCGRRLTPNWEVITSRRGACSTGPRVP